MSNSNGSVANQSLCKRKYGRGLVAYKLFSGEETARNVNNKNSSWSQKPNSIGQWLARAVTGAFCALKFERYTLCLASMSRNASLTFDPFCTELCPFNLFTQMTQHLSSPPKYTRPHYKLSKSDSHQSRTVSSLWLNQTGRRTKGQCKLAVCWRRSCW